ncbi:MAG: RluA family pseudouridine synthase [Alphaproteobacteria bacterium]|nr:RluA family pseudouridine synthase [Alphaproteobacteria bacterium SS10]
MTDEHQTDEALTDDLADEDASAISVEIGEDQIGNRLDKALAGTLADISRSRLQAIINDGGLVDTDSGTTITNPAQKLTRALKLRLTLPEAVEATPEPEDIPLNIVFEDEHLLVLDKPAGMVVHPAAGHGRGTLVNALLHHCGDSLSGIGGVRRPGIVHRLDKDTSGLMVVAKSDQAHQGLAAQFADRSLSRRYTALAWGTPSPREGQIDAAIGRHNQDRKRMTVLEHGGKPAITHYKVTKVFGLLAAAVECQLETGRTHQIRVHMTSIGHPILGDPLYGETRAARKALKRAPEAVRKAIPEGRQALHAHAITFHHPITQTRHDYTSPLPDDLLLLMDQLLTM